VIYRELNKAAIDQRLAASGGATGCALHGRRLRLFCEGLSLCDRGHAFRHNDVDTNVFCFAQREHVEKFRDRFGGEFIDPKDRPRWPGSRRLF
jgi:hypothetical protein